MNFFSSDETAVVAERKPIVVGPSRICPRTGLVEALGHSQKLRRKELELIRYLNVNAGRTVSRDELLSQVWKCPAMRTRTVDQTISSLRRKVGDIANTPRYVITVYGVGYTLNNPTCEDVRSPKVQSDDEPEAATAICQSTYEVR